MTEGLSLFETVLRWLRPPPVDRRPPFYQELRDRGAGRDVIRCTEAYGSDVAEAWGACGRAAWCVDIAARVGVGRALIVRTIADLVAVSDGASELAAQASLEAAEAFAGGDRGRADGGRADGSIEALVESVAELCAAIVEAQPDVREALARISPTGRPDFADVDAYDRIYSDAHRELASVVRRRIPAGEVRVALEGLESHPYR